MKQLPPPSEGDTILAQHSPNDEFDPLQEDVVKEIRRRKYFHLNFGSKPRVIGLSLASLIFALSTLASYLYFEDKVRPYIEVIREVLEK